MRWHNMLSNRIYHSLYWIFIDNDIFGKIITQSHTLSQGQSPSPVVESKSCSWHWYQNLGTKDSTFMAISPVRMYGYSDVVY